MQPDVAPDPCLQAWAVGSPWVTPEEVLRTPRADGGATELMTSRIAAQQQIS